MTALDFRTILSGDSARLVAQALKGEKALERLNKKAKGLASQGIDKAKSSALSLNSALAATGLAIGGIEAARLTVQFQRMARQQKDNRNALIATVGTSQAYAETIKAVRAETRGMVSEAESAAAANVFLAQGLAKNSQEAAELINAGNVLSQTFESQGASMELFTRLLSNGSKVLLDNFNISQAQVTQRQKEIEAATSLSTQEARLQAIRDVAIASAKKYSDAISEDTIAQAQYDAATKDLQASLGDLLMPAFTAAAKESAKFVQELEKGADSWQWIIKDAIPAIQQYNRETLGATSGMEAWEQRFNTLVPKEEKAARAQIEINQALVAGLAPLEDMTTQMGLYEQSLANVVTVTGTVAEQQARMFAQQGAQARAAAGVSALRAQQGQAGAQQQSRFMANQFAMGQVFTGQEGLFDRLLADRDAERARKMADSAGKAADEMARAMERAFSNIQGRLSSIVQPTLGEVFSPGAMADSFRLDEWARRAATLADDMNSQWRGALEEKFGGEDFWQPISDALASGDQGAVAGAVETLLTSDNLPKLWDAEGVKELYRQQIREANLRQTFIDTIAEELAAEEGLVGMGGEGQENPLAGLFGGMAASFQSEIPEAIAETRDAIVLLADEDVALLDEEWAAAIENMVANWQMFQEAGDKATASVSLGFSTIRDRIKSTHNPIEEATRKLQEFIRKGREAKEVLMDLRGTSGGERLAANVSDAAQSMIFPRARGGPVLPGGTYLVGERGPELLRMGNNSGHITSNDQMARGVGTTIHINGPVIVEGVQDPVSFFEAVEREAMNRNKRFATIQ